MKTRIFQQKELRLILLIIMICFVSAMSVNGQSAQIIYVKKGASAPGNGTSWATAYPEMQQALTAAANISGSKQIWVARGEYRPTTNVDRTASFVLPAQTFLYGGFVGNETSLGARNWVTNRTVLSGDLGLLFDKNDNSYHVVVAKNVDGNSGIDGFIVTQGNANGTQDASYNNSGGGMVVISTGSTTAPKIRNCEFVHNSAGSYGGGLANISDGGTVSTQIVNCFFNGNNAVQGGGVGNYKISGSNSPSYVNCSFSTNRASENGGAVANIGSDANIVNGTFSKNSCLVVGGAVYNDDGSSAVIKNSIMWKNFRGVAETGSFYDQIANSQSTPVIQNNIIQGGYGTSTDQNINKDPLFVREPTVVGKFPRTSVIPVTWTDLKYENMVSFSGPKLGGLWNYNAYMDHQYNKLYLPGSNLQVIDFTNLTNGLPTSTLYPELSWGRIQSISRAVHDETNRIYLASYVTGLMSIDRATGIMSSVNVMDGEPITFHNYVAEDVVIDNNNLLYCPISYSITGERTPLVFYGLLELNLQNNTKRWITTTSSPVAVPDVYSPGDDLYWNGHRLFLDKVSNILYYSMGNGVWWWNRNNNTTGVFNTEGGIPLVAGNPKLPSNLTTGMYMDHTENKLYIGTHAGLFVWNRNNNTSKVYNTQNSVLIDNLINHIEKNEDEDLIYAACEFGGVFVLNTVTGEQKLWKKDEGSEVHPGMVTTNTESTYYDPVDKKLYVSGDAPTGGIWIKDYNNLIPDYGNLSLQNESPAIDEADVSIYPSSEVLDIAGLSRFVNYPSISGADSLDLGAYEKALICQQLAADFQFERSNSTYTFTPVLSQGGEACSISYHWDFGDGTTSVEQSPQHTFASIGTDTVILKVTYQCGGCPTSEIIKKHSISVTGLCESIYCHEDGTVSIGTPAVASGYRLSLKGRMIVEGAKVILKSRWPDYVFDNNYKLMPLPELKIFINENGHLPKVPSAQIVKSEGVDVGEMSVLLLEKVEELTLHMIRLDERLKKMETKK